jgi:hypothetical protein
MNIRSTYSVCTMTNEDDSALDKIYPNIILLAHVDVRFSEFISTLQKDFPPAVIESAILSTVDHIFTPYQLKIIQASWVRVSDNKSFDQIEGNVASLATDSNNESRNHERKKFWSLISTGIPEDNRYTDSCIPPNIQPTPRKNGQGSVPLSLADHALFTLIIHRLPSILAKLFYRYDDKTIRDSSYRYTCHFSARKKQNRTGLCIENDSLDDWWLCEGSSLLGYFLSQFFLLVIYHNKVLDMSDTLVEGCQHVSWESDVKATFFKKLMSENYGALFSDIAILKNGKGWYKSFLVGCTAFALDGMVTSVAFRETDKRKEEDAIYPCFFHYGAIGVTDLSSRWIRMMLMENR